MGPGFESLRAYQYIPLYFRVLFCVLVRALFARGCPFLPIRFELLAQN
nr:MAG TPA: hypothetical protein [Caudoviricetes sp.]